MKRKPLIRWERLNDGPNGYKFKALNTVTYFSKREAKRVVVEESFLSDGATGAKDIRSDAWGFHDKVCETGTWEDGIKLCNLQASLLIHDILKEEGRRIRAIRWFFATLFFGGGEARKNGLFKVKND